jgi:hypothetical protein
MLERRRSYRRKADGGSNTVLWMMALTMFMSVLASVIGAKAIIATDKFNKVMDNIYRAQRDPLPGGF